MPKSFRKSHAYAVGVVIAVEVWMLELGGIYFGWFPDVDDPNIAFLEARGVDRKMSEIVVAGRLITLTAFFLKNIWAKCAHPDVFVNLKAHLLEKEYKSATEFVKHRLVKAKKEASLMRRFSLALSSADPQSMRLAKGDNFAQIVEPVRVAPHHAAAAQVLRTRKCARSVQG